MKFELEKAGHNRSKQLTTLFGCILLSIILHLMLTLGFFQHGFHKRAMTWLSSITQDFTPDEQRQRTEQIKQKRDSILKILHELKPEKNDNRPAMLRAPKSQFGWVLFDEPESKKVDPSTSIEIPTTMEGSIGQALTAQATEDEDNVNAEIIPENLPTPQDGQVATAEPTEQAQDQTAPHKQTLPAEEFKSIPSSAPVEPLKEFKLIEKQEPITEKATQAGVSIHQPNTDSHLQKNPDAQLVQNLPHETLQYAKKIQVLEAKLSTYKQHSTPEPRSQQHAIASIRGAQSLDQKPKRNIIALTKGFVEKIHGQDGKDLIDRDGDSNKMPSLEELKYLSYESKINWCLQASWKQNFCYTPAREALEGIASIEFTLDKYGNVTNCTLLQSTGHTELDKMVMKNMKVASPFPPIPKHFGVTNYTTRRNITIYSNRFAP